MAVTLSRHYHQGKRCSTLELQCGGYYDEERSAYVFNDCQLQLLNRAIYHWKIATEMHKLEIESSTVDDAGYLHQKVIGE